MELLGSVLAPLDCTPAAEAGLGWAVRAAERSHAAVELLTVVEDEIAEGNGHVAHAEEYLRAHRDHIATSGLAVNLEVVSGSPPECILDRASSSELTVMTYGTKQWLFGGALDLMLREMTQPLVVVRSPFGQASAALDSGKILVPVDTAPYSSDALPQALELARAFAASIVLCHVIEPVGPYLDPAEAPPGVARVIEDLMEEARSFLSIAAAGIEREGARVEIIVTMGEAPREIVLLAERCEAGLIAMATRGTQTLSRVMGSVAYGVLQFGRVPCLLIRPAGTA
jgi:nucleotide-binding universal stress UspA family protein